MVFAPPFISAGGDSWIVTVMSRTTGVHSFTQRTHDRPGIAVDDRQQDACCPVGDAPPLFPVLHDPRIESEPIRYPPTNSYTTALSRSISSSSMPRTSPLATSRMRNPGGTFTVPSHSPSGAITV